MWTLFAAALLSAQSAYARDYECWQREAGASCWAEIRALYAAEPIEQLQRRGMQVRRMFFLDSMGRISLDGRGHGQQAGLISVEQAAGGTPVLVYHPARRADLAAVPLTAPLSPADWTEILTATVGMGGGRPAGADACLHGWDFVIEGADPDAGRVARHSESSCGNGPAWSLADRLTRLAVHAFPDCGAPPGEALWSRMEWLHRCSLRRAAS